MTSKLARVGPAKDDIVNYIGASPEQGFGLNTKNDRENTSVTKGHFKVEKETDVNNIELDNGIDVSMWAAGGGHVIDIIKFLVKKRS